FDDLIGPLNGKAGPLEQYRALTRSAFEEGQDVAQNGLGLFQMQEMTDAGHDDALEAFRESCSHIVAKPHRHAAVVLPVQVECWNSDRTIRASFEGLRFRFGRRSKQLPIVGERLG